MIIAIADSYCKTVFYVLAALLGLCVGSFLNVVIYRVPRKMSLAKPPSHCPVCGARIRFFDNVPIFSYLFLRGRCRSCKARIPFRYTLVEFSNALLWLLCAVIYTDNVVYAVISALVCSICICVFFIDLESMVIFDRFQVMLALLSLAAVFFDSSCTYAEHFIGLLAAALLFIPLDLIVSKKVGREALGGGDIKLALSAGLLLGWSKFILMVLLASVSGSVVLCALRKKEGASNEKPFAPFLTAALVVVLLAGTPVIDWYVSFLTY